MWDLAKYSQNVVIHDDKGNILSYGELDEIGDRISCSIAKRCLVVVFCKNSIGSAIGYISFINHNIVPMMLSANLDKELRNNLLNAYMPDYLWLPKQMISEFSDYDIEYVCYDYVLLKTNYNHSYLLNSELALLLSTSGSTGSPKFVRQSYDNICANAESIVEYLGIDTSEKAITTLPMNYTYGLSIINSHLLVGATILITDKSIMQKEFWEFLKNNEATSFGGVPYTYEMLKRIKFMNMRLPSIKTITQAGGKLSSTLQEEFAIFANKNNIDFVVMYGQCEATARMAYLPSNRSIEKKGSVGIAIPGGEFFLIDIEGNIITSPNTVGELVYKGRNVTLGYAECGDDLIKGDERNGILYTGDMAQCDGDGFYYIVGRKKRFLKIYGVRVNLDEIDQLIKEEFGGIDCASSGRDDCMAIFITEEKYAEDIKRYVSQKTKISHNALKIIVIPNIPKSESGKILYKDLEDFF